MRLAVWMLVAAMAALSGTASRAALPVLCQEGLRATDQTEKVRLFTRCIGAGLNDPRDLALAFGYRGMAYGNLGQDELAVQDSDQAIALDAGNPMFFNIRGRGRLDMGQYELAVADFDQAIALNRNSVYAFHNRGWCFFLLGQYDRAIGDLDEAIRLDPRQGGAYADRGRIYNRLFNYTKARADLTQALALAPTDARTLNSLADFLATCPEPEYQDGPRAVELARKACAKQETAWRLSTLAAALARCGRFHEALSVQEKAVVRAKAEKLDWDAFEWFKYCRENYRQGKPCSDRKYGSAMD